MNKTAARDQEHAASLQKQINELRSELICAEAPPALGASADATLWLLRHKRTAAH